MSFTRRRRSSLGRSKQLKDNQDPRAADHQISRSFPSTKRPSASMTRRTPSRQYFVMGTLDLEGNSCLQPRTAAHVPRSRGPESFSFFCNDKTPKVTQCKRSPSRCAASTAFSKIRSTKWGGVSRVIVKPKVSTKATNHQPASRRLLR